MNPLMRMGIAGHVKLYRSSNGTKGGSIKGMPVLLLSTTGRKSGKERTVPLVYVEDGENWLIAASAGGAPKSPAWFFNIQADNRVTVQVGTEVHGAEAVLGA
jgi:deazaflavin-dependent oxidoreductase (nitroreductase family)